MLVAPAQACKFIPGVELIQTEPSEAVDKLRLLLRVLGAFKGFYFEYRAITIQETPDMPWKFQNSSLFARLDTFMERCHDMMDMMSTCVQFNKLERVEIGGTKVRAQQHIQLTRMHGDVWPDAMVQISIPAQPGRQCACGMASFSWLRHGPD